MVAGAGASTRLPVQGYQLAMVVTASLAAAGGLIALVGLPVREHAMPAAADTVTS